MAMRLDHGTDELEEVHGIERLDMLEPKWPADRKARERITTVAK